MYHCNATGNSSFNFTSARFAKLDETSLIYAGHNFSGRTRYSPDSARPGHFLCARRRPTGLRTECFGSNRDSINHARNVSIGESISFPDYVKQFSFGYNRIFTNTSQGTGRWRSQSGSSGANLGCDSSNTASTADIAAGCTSVGFNLGSTFWSLGDRGIRRSRRHQYFSVTIRSTYSRKARIKVGIGIRRIR